MNTSKKLHVRKFLNRKEGMAAIEVDFHSKSGGSISITDCSRSVHLECNVYTHNKRKRKQEQKEIVHKLTVLQDTINQALEFMTNEFELDIGDDEDLY